MNKNWKAAVIGECMIELRRENGVVTQTYGGDTLNTAVYLKRASGAPVEYISALGDQDPYSEEMVEFWESNGIGSSMTQRLAHKLPGLYAIEVDDKGERSFLYWRGESAAKSTFSTQAGQDILDSLWMYDLIHLSGISLAILNPEGRERLLNALEKLAARDIPISFDFNYRPQLWGDKPEENAAPFYRRMAKIAKWVFLSPEELKAAGLELKDGDDPAPAIKELEAKYVVLKNGDKPCRVYREGDLVLEAPAPDHLDPVDTTAAGDSFTAGYLAAAMSGLAPDKCVQAGQKLASAVIMHPGAIIAREDTPELTLN